MEILIGFTAIIAILVLYTLPTIIAFHRGHSATLGILVFNVLLGWTGVMWIGCIIWACDGLFKSHKGD